MDYYSLGDLTRLMISGPFGESDARNIAEQILHAVFVLHDEAIIHRDIKPQVRPWLYLAVPTAKVLSAD